MARFYSFTVKTLLRTIHPSHELAHDHNGTVASKDETGRRFAFFRSEPPS